MIKSSRKFHKSRKVYIQRPIGRGGKTWTCQNVHRTNILFGGGFSVYDSVLGVWSQAPSPINWSIRNNQFATSVVPLCIPTSSLQKLLFDSNYDGTVWGTLEEAKYPDMFRYRYVVPSYFGVSLRILRTRIIVDTDASHAEYSPSPVDAANSEISTQIPVHIYWRGDFSNLNKFYKFYEPWDSGVGGNVLDDGDPRYYLPSGDGSASGAHFHLPGTALGSYANNLNELLLNKRFSKCTVQPGSDCIISYGGYLKPGGLDGTMVDVKNTQVFQSRLIKDQAAWPSGTYKPPVTMFLRNFNKNVHQPGQQGYTPGDLYILPVIPDLQPSMLHLLNVPDHTYVDGDSKKNALASARARLSVELELKTTLVMKGSEYLPDNFQWGSSGLPS